MGRRAGAAQLRGAGWVRGLRTVLSGTAGGSAGSGEGPETELAACAWGRGGLAWCLVRWREQAGSGKETSGPAGEGWVAQGEADLSGPPRIHGALLQSSGSRSA